MTAGTGNRAGDGAVNGGANAAGRSAGGSAGLDGVAGTNAAGARNDDGGSNGEAGHAGTQNGDGGDGAAAGSAGDGDGEGESGAGGEAGASGDGSHEYAYIASFLGGVLGFEIDLVSGKPRSLPGSPWNKGAQLYAASVDPTQRFLYTVQTGEPRRVSVYRIADNGTLPATPTSTKVLSGSPNTLALDALGRFAYVGSSDEDESLYVFKLDSTTGELTTSPTLAVKARPAYVATDPTGHFVYITQLFETGVRGYAVDQTTGALAELATSPYGGEAVLAGAIAFEPSGRFLYTAGKGLNQFSVAANGKLELITTTPVTTDIGSDPSATNLAVDPKGKYLYGAQFQNQGHVFGYSIAADTGKLTAVPGASLGSSGPYSVGVDPSGRYVLVGGDNGNFSVLSLKRADGSLKAIENSPFPIQALQPEITFATLH